jgi:hypothetical protein
VRSEIAARDLQHKGEAQRQQDYLDRTLQKALRRIGDARRLTTEK